MSSTRNRSWGANQNGHDRSGLFGMLALLSLALPALGIRYLLPDMNPLFLAALGGAVYAVYLAVLMRQMAQSVDMEPALEAERVETSDLEASQWRKS